MAAPTPGLLQITLVFGRLGMISFGGPAAHVALMRRELVERLGWLGDRELLDLVAAANLIPGPNSTEVAMHVGWRYRRLPGLVLAGTAFILPAFVTVLAVAIAYREFGGRPDAAWLLAGVSPVVLAVVLDALWRFARAAVHSAAGAVLVVAGALVAMAGVHELAILGVAAVLPLLRPSVWTRAALVTGPWTLATSLMSAAASSAAPAAVPVTLTALTLFFLKVGSVLFGSGYVLLAFLRADLVERWHWLTPQQLLDAVAVGQFTPGPLFTTATFIGYILAGLPGAIVATVGIFAPAFAFVAITAPWLSTLRASRRLSAVLDAVVLASLGLMAAVTLFLGRNTLTTVPRAALWLTALALLLWKRPNSVWLILAGGALGWLTNGL